MDTEKITLSDWVRQNRYAIDNAARAAGGETPSDDDEREDWVANVESLYLWAQADGVDV